MLCRKGFILPSCFAGITVILCTNFIGKMRKGDPMRFYEISEMRFDAGA